MTESDDLRDGLWGVMPDHLAAIAVDSVAASDLGAEEIARRSGAVTPVAQAAILRAISARDRNTTGHSARDVVDLLDSAEAPRRRAKPPARWGGLGVCCPKGRSHRIGALALRLDGRWQLELRNAGRDAREFHEVTIATATAGHVDSALQASHEATRRAAESLRAVASDIRRTAGAPAAYRDTAACIETAVESVMHAVDHQDPDAVDRALRPTHFDPYLCSLHWGSPLLRLLTRFEDNAPRAAGSQPAWMSGFVGDTVTLPCPHCDYRGSHTIKGLISQYALAIARERTWFALVS